MRPGLVQVPWSWRGDGKLELHWPIETANTLKSFLKTGLEVAAGIQSEEWAAGEKTSTQKSHGYYPLISERAANNWRKDKVSHRLAMIWVAVIMKGWRSELLILSEKEEHRETLNDVYLQEKFPSDSPGFCLSRSPLCLASWQLGNSCPWRWAGLLWSC